MSTIELKHIIAEQLAQIEDESFLNAIKTIIESKISGATYNLNDSQKERVNAAREELLSYQTISHDDLQKEVDKWLIEE